MENNIKKFLSKLNEYIEDLDEQVEKEEDDEDVVDESNDTYSAGGEYSTPHAFFNRDEDEIQSFMLKQPYTLKASDEKKNVAESTDFFDEIEKRILSLQESFDMEKQMSMGEQIDKQIAEINRNFRIVERCLKEAKRLKTESGKSYSQYWKKTRGRLEKLEERAARTKRLIRELYL